MTTSYDDDDLVADLLEEMIALQRRRVRPRANVTTVVLLSLILIVLLVDLALTAYVAGVVNAVLAPVGGGFGDALGALFG